MPSASRRSGEWRWQAHKPGAEPQEEIEPSWVKEPGDPADRTPMAAAATGIGPHTPGEDRQSSDGAAGT